MTELHSLINSITELLQDETDTEILHLIYLLLVKNKATI